MAKLTKPQARFLAQQMRAGRPVTAYGPEEVVVRNLESKGFVDRCTVPGMRFLTHYRATRAGLEALLYDRKMEDCRRGSIATMERVREVEGALKRCEREGMPCFQIREGVEL